MKVEKIHIENFTQFTDLPIELSSDVIVFIGNNGAGKTSILRIISTLLSWLIARIKQEKGKGSPISDLDIKNNANYSKITVEVLADNQTNFQWTLAKQRKGFKNNQNSNLKDVTHLADLYRNSLTQNEKSNLPLVIYYPVERAVLNIPLKINSRYSFEQLDGYDNAIIGTDFQHFFEWFREREDAENEKSRITLELIKNNPQKIHEKFLYDDKQLTAVRDAIATFIPVFSKLRIQRKPKLRMTVQKHGQTLDVTQLSQGEKSLMALVGDIARRMVIMNPCLENPLHGDGIVLIDEIDLHLHPQWQRGIIQRLHNTFPNCQFFLATHSPLVISDAKDLECYVLDNKQLTPLKNLYGLDVNQVLVEAMNTEIRNEEVQEKITELLDHIQDGDLKQANTTLHQLETDLFTNHIELIKARLLIKRLEVLHAKNK
ncbi:AAA family ATPase [Thiotrichales bacterium HSG1]|nr:AAA family ATPase [Thiotrichales bacterium HSG1]